MNLAASQAADQPCLTGLLSTFISVITSGGPQMTSEQASSYEYASTLRQCRCCIALGLARQRLQERDQIAALLIGERQRHHQRRPTRPSDAAFLIVPDHIVQRRRRGIVHVRRT